MKTYYLTACITILLGGTILLSPCSIAANTTVTNNISVSANSGNQESTGGTVVTENASASVRITTTVDGVTVVEETEKTSGGKIHIEQTITEKDGVVYASTTTSTTPTLRETSQKVASKKIAHTSTQNPKVVTYRKIQPTTRFRTPVFCSFFYYTFFIHNGLCTL